MTSIGLARGDLGLILGGMTEMDFTRIELIGTVQPHDAEQRFTPDGRAVLLFRMVVGRGRKQADGTWLNESDWFSVRVFGPMAERLGDKLLKGRRLYVAGRFQSHEWTTTSGEKRTDLQILAADIVLLGERPAAQGQAPAKEDAALEDLPW